MGRIRSGSLYNGACLLRDFADIAVSSFLDFYRLLPEIKPLVTFSNFDLTVGTRSTFFKEKGGAKNLSLGGSYRLR